MIGRADEPAFLYLPDNYRWSMGLLICLGASAWTGIEINEVHRVVRALAQRVGDDSALLRARAGLPCGQTSVTLGPTPCRRGTMGVSNVG